MDDGHFGYINTSLFISLCILSDLPQQKIPRELCSQGDPTIFLCSHVPMERFFDGADQENSKNTRRKVSDQENSKKQEGNNGGKKEKRSLRTWRFPYSCVLHWVGMPLGNTLVGPSLKRTSYGNLQNHKIGKKTLLLLSSS
jgi:hypothetical protein